MALKGEIIIFIRGKGFVQSLARLVATVSQECKNLSLYLIRLILLHLNSNILAIYKASSLTPTVRHSWLAFSLHMYYHEQTVQFQVVKNWECYVEISRNVSSQL